MIRRGLSGLAVLFIITTFLAAGIAGYEYNQYNQLTTRYNMVSGKYRSMKSQYQLLNRTYHILIAEYNGLKTRYDNVSKSYSNLQDKYSSLENNYNKLQNLYDTLKSTYSTLQYNYSILQNKYSSLTDKYSRLSEKYDSLHNNYTILLNEYNSLYENYTSLLSKYNNLLNSYNQLQGNYTRLLAQWNNLVNEYDSLQQDYNHLKTEYDNLWQLYQGNMNSEFKSLVDNYEAWYEYAWGVIQFTNATIPRVYSQEQYNYLYNIIMNNVSLTDPSDWWLSVYQLYQYEIETVKYVNDEPEPMPPYIQDLIYGTYKNETLVNSIMAPNETLELKQGDCDDQAVLLYGLIDTYEKYILGTDHVEWLVFVEMGDGSWHMTVFIPIQGGKLTITDPAGHYLTLDQYGHLTSNNALQELQKYSDWWSYYGGIKYIELYEIHGDKAYMVADGTIYDIAEYITSVTT